MLDELKGASVYDKEIEKLTRKVNLSELTINAKEKKIQELHKKMSMQLDTIESFLSQQLRAYQRDKNINKFVAEMDRLIGAVRDEKKLISRLIPGAYERENNDEKKSKKK